MKNKSLNNKRGGERFERNLFQRMKGVFGPLIAISVVINILMLTIPLYFMQIFDRVMPSQNYDTLIFLTLFAFCAIVTSASLEWIRSHILVRVSRWLEDVVSTAAMVTFTEQLLNGNPLALKVQTDIHQVKSFSSSKIVYAFIDLPWTPLYLLTIAFLNFWIGLIVTCGGVVLILLTLFYDKLTKERINELQQRAKQTNVYASAFSKMPHTLEVLGLDGILLDRWRAVKGEHQQEDMNLTSKDTLFEYTLKGFRMTLQIILLSTGAYLVLNNQMTSGALVASSLIATRALAPIEQIVAAWRNVQAARIGWLSLRDFLSYKKVIKSVLGLKELKGPLKVEKLYFAPDRRMVLQSIDFSLPSGKILVLSGLSGAGKTSLLKVLSGSVKPSTGRVLMNGIDISKLSRKEIGPFMGYASQNIELSYATIRDTICRFQEDATDESIVLAAKMAGCHERIIELEEGYNTFIETDSPLVSQGVKQAIVLARAFYGNPSYILLDEPFNFLDGPSRKTVFESLIRLKEKGSTIVVAGNEQETVRCADYILVLEKGACVKFEQLALMKNQFQEKQISTPKSITSHVAGEINESQ